VATLSQWTAEACRALDLVSEDINSSLVLDLARDVAHDVMRPAAPLTAYLVGVAVGRGMAPAQARDAVAELISAWTAAHPPAQDGQDQHAPPG
jgi:Domain of unknown function (DUF6457)